jgi:hypothetical protein
MAELKEYICSTPCFHAGVRFEVGDRMRFSDKDVPRTKGKIRHFDLVVKEEPPAKKSKREEE